VWRILAIGVGLMSGLLSVVREFLLFTAPTRFQERPLFWGSVRVTFLVAGVLYCVIETKERQSAQEKMRLLEKKYHDERPKLSLDVVSAEGETQWFTTGNPVQFQLVLLAGRSPTNIRFAPVVSMLGSYALHFDSLPHLEPNRVNALSSEVRSVGHLPLGHRDRHTIGDISAEMLRLFVGDNPEALQAADYVLVAHYRDNDEDLEHTFHLRFDPHRFRFERNTA